MDDDRSDPFPVCMKVLQRIFLFCLGPLQEGHAYRVEKVTLAFIQFWWVLKTMPGVGGPQNHKREQCYTSHGFSVEAGECLSWEWDNACE
jgi:hypothetical protein